MNRNMKRRIEQLESASNSALPLYFIQPRADESDVDARKRVLRAYGLEAFPAGAVLFVARLQGRQG